jgi:hypothetical protein
MPKFSYANIGIARLGIRLSANFPRLTSSPDMAEQSEQERAAGLAKQAVQLVVAGKAEVFTTLLVIVCCR